MDSPLEEASLLIWWEKKWMCRAAIQNKNIKKYYETTTESLLSSYMNFFYMENVLLVLHNIFCHDTK